MTHGSDKSSSDQYHPGSRARFLFPGLLLLNILALFWQLKTGTVRIPGAELLMLLRQGPESAAAGGLHAGILFTLRLPRALCALLLGGALALSGYLLQTYFDNPVAGPFILGISSGARLCVALAMVFFVQRWGRAGSAVLLASAFSGALLSTALVLFLAARVKHMASILVGGIMIGYISNAVTDILITFASEQDIVNLRGWSLGSFSGTEWKDVLLSFCVLVPVVLLVLGITRDIRALQLGEGYARSVGVHIRRLRILLILYASLLSAAVTAIAGPVSFVGVAVPYLAKRLFRTSHPLVLVPACVLGGAFFTCGADLIARTAFMPEELNISTVTAVFGAPVVLWLVLERSGSR